MSHESSSHEDIRHAGARDNDLQRINTTSSVMMTSELFEKLYLQPLGKVKGDLRSTFGNPTPLGLVGFVIGLTPLACCLMGWRGAGGTGAADIGVYIFIGGPCLIISGFLEFFLGNTFPFVVFFTYGTVFLALGGTLQPFYNAAGAYAAGDAVTGATMPAFNASLAYWPLSVSCLNLFWFICAFKINVVFVLIFVGAGTGFATFAGALFAAAEGSLSASATLVQATGGLWFVTSLLGWYLLLIQLLGTMGFTIQLPVGDLSNGFGRKKAAHVDKEKV